MKEIDLDLSNHAVKWEFSINQVSLFIKKWKKDYIINWSQSVYDKNKKYFILEPSSSASSKKIKDHIQRTRFSFEEAINHMKEILLKIKEVGNKIEFQKRLD